MVAAAGAGCAGPAGARAGYNPRTMRPLLEFLKQHKLAWILPIVIFAVLIAVVAWRMSETPENPFAYRDT